MSLAFVPEKSALYTRDHTAFLSRAFFKSQRQITVHTAKEQHEMHIDIGEILQQSKY